MQKLAILTAPNQAGNIQLNKNAEQANALSKNNEPNVSFKSLLLNQAKPAEPVKTAPKNETAAKDNAATPNSQNTEKPAGDHPASAENDGASAPASKTVGSKLIAIKNTANSKLPLPTVDLAKTAADELGLPSIAANGEKDPGTTAGLTPELKLRAVEDDQTEIPPPVTATMDANAAMIAALNLPAKTAIINTAIQPDAEGGSPDQGPSTLSMATGRQVAPGGDASPKTMDKKSLEVKVNNQPTPADEPIAQRPAAGNQAFNALLEQRLNVKSTLQESVEKMQAPAINALANTPPPASAALPAHINAAQTAMNTINAYPGKTGWDQAISQKVVWMVGAADQTATLTLNPPDLGPLQVVINVNNDKADTTFISQNPEVRKALEDGMDNLRQLMDQAGVQLGQTSVNDGKQSAFFQQASREQRFQQASGNKSIEPNSAIAPSASVSRINQGLVDTFA